MITIYNTLTRKKEEFKPLEKGKINMYVCGPTVYDVPHIGHARSAYIFEFIRRYFEYVGFEVLFVRNVTDVDDKIINKAASELEDLGERITAERLKERSREVAVRYLDHYHREMDILGIRIPVFEPKATENIREMITFIEKLIEKGYAYASGGNVYFSVEEVTDYGKLSGQDREQMTHGVRIEVDERKQYPLDFALWKEVKSNEPSWPSPWGDGRPGWHIECSVMSTAILGESFDIHGGGLDLIFPHHENEIAQAEAATGKKFANYWIHNGLLTINGEKMSKSLGNYTRISDFLEKYEDPDLLKMIFLSSHYRSPMDYNEDKIEEARRSRERIMIFKDKTERIMKDLAGTSGDKKSNINKVMVKAQNVANDLQTKFDEAMNDDFNTSQALSVIFEAVRVGNEYLSNDEFSREEKAHMANAVKNSILRFADVLCLSLSFVQVDDAETEEIERLVSAREEARKNKDYAASDKARDELAEKGVVVEDTQEGPVWRKS